MCDLVKVSQRSAWEFDGERWDESLAAGNISEAVPLKWCLSEMYQSLFCPNVQ